MGLAPNALKLFSIGCLGGICGDIECLSSGNEKVLGIERDGAWSLKPCSWASEVVFVYNHSQEC